MNNWKLLRGLAFVVVLGLGTHQAGAVNCTSPQEAWVDEAYCSVGTGSVQSYGYTNGFGNLGLQLWSSGACPTYMDAYGYSSTGLRKVLCNPTGGLVGGVCYNYGADDTNCNGSVTHDAYGDWP
jgi:hypothetical protein